MIERVGVVIEDGVEGDGEGGDEGEGDGNLLRLLECKELRVHALYVFHTLLRVLHQHVDLAQLLSRLGQLVDVRSNVRHCLNPLQLLQVCDW